MAFRTGQNMQLEPKSFDSGYAVQIFVTQNKHDIFFFWGGGNIMKMVLHTTHNIPIYLSEVIG